MAHSENKISSIVVGGVPYDVCDRVAHEEIAALKAGGVQYIGRTITALTDGATTTLIKIVTNASTNPVTTKDVTPETGNLVIYNAGTDSEHKDLEFIWNGDHWDELGSTGALGELAYLDLADIKADTEHNHELLAKDTTVQLSGGTTSGVAVANHDYTPTGKISVGTGTANYTPGGTIEVTINKSNVEHSATMSGSTADATVTAHTYTPAGNVTVSTTKTLGSGEQFNYTPEGSISAITATAAEDTHNHTASGTLNVSGATVSAHSVTQGKVKIDNHSFTPSGTVTSTFTGTEATISHEAHTHTVDLTKTDKTLSHTVTQGNVTIPAHTYTPAGTVSLINGTQTLTHSVTVGNVTGTTTAVTASVSGETLTLATGAITVNKPSVTIGNHSVSAPTSATFAGTEATLSHTKTNVVGCSVANHTIKTVDSASAANATVAAHTYTPAGTISSTFAGSAATLKHTQANTTTGTYDQLNTTGIAVANHTVTGGSVNASGITISDDTHTHTISVSQPTFTGSGVLIKAAFAGSQATLSHAAHKHAVGTIGAKVTVSEVSTVTAAFTGTPVQLVFTGDKATLTHTVTQGTVTGSITYHNVTGLMKSGGTGNISRK